MILHFSVYKYKSICLYILSLPVSSWPLLFPDAFLGEKNNSTVDLFHIASFITGSRNLRNSNQKESEAKVLLFATAAQQPYSSQLLQQKNLKLKTSLGGGEGREAPNGFPQKRVFAQNLQCVSALRQHWDLFCFQCNVGFVFHNLWHLKRSCRCSSSAGSN